MRPYNEEPVPPVVSDPLIPAGAGFGIRFLARLIDLIFGLLLGLVAGIVIGIFVGVLAAMGRVDQGWVTRVNQTTAVGLILGLLGAFLYHTFTDGIGGASLGKLICGLNVVQTDGRPCTLLGAFKRDLLYHGDALFFGLVGYQSMKDSALQQRYGDVWGKTVVVQKKIFKATPGRSPWRITLGILAGSFFWVSALCADMLLKVF